MKSKLKRIDVITLFPEILEALQYGITGRTIKRGLLSLHTWNPRDYTTNKHQTVDDRPYGGGPGMVMALQPLHDTIKAAKADESPQQQIPAATSSSPAHVIYLSPRGHLLTQQRLEALVAYPRLILVAGRYEGIDQRLIDLAIDETCSIGDYVLSGGEIASLVMIDCLARLLPEALGCAESAQQDSFANGLLDWPHYTRPEVYEGKCVPDVLLSGNHQAIARWRLQQALGQTALMRPDLLEKRKLNDKEKRLLDEFFEAYNNEQATRSD